MTNEKPTATGMSPPYRTSIASLPCAMKSEATARKKASRSAVMKPALSPGAFLCQPKNSSRCCSIDDASARSSRAGPISFSKRRILRRSSWRSFLSSAPKYDSMSEGRSSTGAGSVSIRSTTNPASPAAFSSAAPKPKSSGVDGQSRTAPSRRATSIASAAATSAAGEDNAASLRSVGRRRFGTRLGHLHPVLGQERLVHLEEHLFLLLREARGAQDGKAQIAVFLALFEDPGAHVQSLGRDTQGLGD